MLMIVVLFVLVSCNVQPVPQYIKDLDEALNNKTTFLDQKEFELLALKHKLSNSNSLEEKYYRNIELCKH